MNLIACPDCAQPVSSLAADCPACGRPLARMQASPYGDAYAPMAAYRAAQEKQSVQLGYGLYAGSFLVGPLLIAAVIYAYVKRGEARGTWLESHYTWLIDTFWVWIGGMALGGAFALFWFFAFFPIGALLALAVGLGSLGWPIYRLIRGWTRLSEGQPAVGSLSPPRW